MISQPASTEREDGLGLGLKTLALVFLVVWSGGKEPSMNRPMTANLQNATKVVKLHANRGMSI